MKNSIFLYLNLFLLSAVILCFEITSTRISSVIFVSDYAFFILSLAILGLGSGGIFYYYRVKENKAALSLKIISRSLSLFGVSLCLFIILVINFSIADPFLYFFLLFLPFFFAGIVYAQIFKTYAEHSFILYASDLSGAAIGSIASLGLFSFCGAPNSILLLTIIVFGTALCFNRSRMKRIKIIGLYTILFLSLFMLLYNGKNEFQTIALPLTVFSCIGVGFMIMEVSLFQKLVLYLGSPTISLSILLSSLLAGMGMGSYWGEENI
jgi:hypothetical protein